MIENSKEELIQIIKNHFEYNGNNKQATKEYKNLEKSFQENEMDSFIYSDSRTYLHNLIRELRLIRVL